VRRAAPAVAALALLLAVPAVADPTPTPTVQEPDDVLVVSVTDLLPRAPEAGQALRSRAPSATAAAP
jgi:hypothetical protein